MHMIMISNSDNSWQCYDERYERVVYFINLYKIRNVKERIFQRNIHKHVTELLAMTYRVIIPSLILQREIGAGMK